MDGARRSSGHSAGAAAPNPPQQYYVAVGSTDVKLATLEDLLLAVKAGGAVSLVVHCSARDSLDEVAAGLARLEDTFVTCLHADLSDRERDAAVAAFTQRARLVAAADAGGAPGPDAAPNRHSDAASPAEGGGQATAHVLAATDVGMRALEGRGGPVVPPLLVHYDLPVRKDVFSRRAALAHRARQPGGRPPIVVFFVTAGQVGDFRTVEGHAGGSAAIEEMPVHVAELFGR